MSDRPENPDIDRRLEALTMNLKLMRHSDREFRKSLVEIRDVVFKAADNINALARIAEIRQLSRRPG
jgi:hypothetical protein